MSEEPKAKFIQPAELQDDWRPKRYVKNKPKRLFTEQELRSAMAREIRYIRGRRTLYLGMARNSQLVETTTMYARSASACSAMIQGIQELAKRLGLIKEKRDEDIRL